MWDFVDFDYVTVASKNKIDDEIKIFVKVEAANQCNKYLQNKNIFKVLLL